MFNFLDEKIFKRFRNKFSLTKKGFSRKPVSIAAGSLALVMVLTGCSNEKAADSTQASTDVGSGVVSESQELTIEEQLALLQQRVDELEAANGASIGANDTYSQSDWSSFVADSLTLVNGKINNNSKVRFELGLSILNIEYLSENGEKVLMEQFSRGEDVESILNAEYSLASQIREWNTEITSADDYIAYSNFMLSESDKEIISQLESYAKEVITLSQNLTAENKTRIQEIFDMFLAFSNGTGTIEMTIGGETKAVAEIDLSRGAIFATENIAQTISVMSKDIVSQELREQLDGELRSRDNLAKVQELIIKYSTLGTLKGVDIELQTQIFDNYTKSFAIVQSELAVMDVTEEEAKALYTLCNIDYFVDSLESQNVFDLIYADGIDINSMFELAESAVSKIVIYNDSQASADKVYDLGRLSFANTGDIVSLRAFAQTAYNVNSTDADISANAINIVKGYSQYSSDVTVDYQTMDDDGNIIEHSLDKNALSKGATQVINLYTYYSVMNHKATYGPYADAILPLVDGSQAGLNPYDSIVLMVEDHCADRNIIVYDYAMGEASPTK